MFAEVMCLPLTEAHARPDDRRLAGVSGFVHFGAGGSRRRWNDGKYPRGPEKTTFGQVLALYVRLEAIVRSYLPFS